MKTTRKIFTIILLLTFHTIVSAQTEAEMKAWTDYMTPGMPHEMLAKSDGDWTGAVTMWMAPGAPPQTMDGTMSNKMILGGRYQYSTFTGTMMGMPFEGISITGYDNSQKKYISSWIDNMGTGIMNMSGTWDNATNSIIFTGTMPDPMTGKDCQVREVFKIIDDNNHVMEMYDNKTGKEEKSMQIKFTRK
ncbi:MAG: DUF1579 domain-containing protein [Ignavibacteria bacterium]|nr:DUF1579 domain-containing protein [Ignavibacteria bacterium]